MPSILSKFSIFACLLLLVLVGGVSSFETPSHAAESRQTARLATGSAQSSTNRVNSQTSDNGEVNVIVSTLDRGIVSTRVVATMPSANAFTVTFLLATSLARALVRPIIPAFDAE